jgi:prepilin-type N-terminal cleavage/methylation domain-containing protein
MNDKKGFTLIELLIAIGVVLIIGTLAALAVNSARAKQRDATRLSQVRMLQAAMENYFNDQNAYPDNQALPLGDARLAACLGEAGFAADCAADKKVYLKNIAGTLPSGLKGQVTCGTPPRNAFCYTALLDASTYRIQFEIEKDWLAVGLKKGINCASPEGVAAGRCRE